MCGDRRVPYGMLVRPRQRTPRARGEEVTDYDAIAHVYRESKRLPIKQYSEGFTLFQVLGSVHDLAVLDVACWDGYYTQTIKRQVVASLSRPSAHRGLGSTAMNG
jgi:hypothetical protein